MNKVRGRKKGVSNGNFKPKDACEYCEGSGGYFGGKCGACDGSGSEKERRRFQKIYNLQNRLPIHYNLNPKIDDIFEPLKKH